MACFKNNSGEIRNWKSASKALWCVVKGFAAAPDAMFCIIGVSISKKPFLFINSRKLCVILKRPSNALRASGLEIISKYLWR